MQIQANCESGKKKKSLPSFSFTLKTLPCPCARACNRADEPAVLSQRVLDTFLAGEVWDAVFLNRERRHDVSSHLPEYDMGKQ